MSRAVASFQRLSNFRCAMPDAVDLLAEVARPDVGQAEDVRLVEPVSEGAEEPVDRRGHLGRRPRPAGGDPLDDGQVEADAGGPFSWMSFHAASRAPARSPRATSFGTCSSQGTPGPPAGSLRTSAAGRGGRSLPSAESRATIAGWFSNPQ